MLTSKRVQLFAATLTREKLTRAGGGELYDSVTIIPESRRRDNPDFLPRVDLAPVRSDPVLVAGNPRNGGLYSVSCLASDGFNLGGDSGDRGYLENAAQR